MSNFRVANMVFWQGLRCFDARESHAVLKTPDI